MLLLPLFRREKRELAPLLLQLVLKRWVADEDGAEGERRGSEGERGGVEGGRGRG